jgi:hypothetical protein
MLPRLFGDERSTLQVGVEWKVRPLRGIKSRWYEHATLKEVWWSLRQRASQHRGLTLTDHATYAPLIIYDHAFNDEFVSTSNLNPLSRAETSEQWLPRSSSRSSRHSQMTFPLRLCTPSPSQI